MKFLSPEVALYLCESTMQSCMDYCCHIWAGAPSCYLELLDKLQKRICRTFGPSFAASLESLAHHQNAASLRLLYRYLLDVHLNWLNWFHFLILEGGLLVILMDCMIFVVTIPRCYKDIYVNSFFPRIARPRNSLPIEYFPLSYDLCGFKSGISRYLLTVGSF